MGSKSDPEFFQDISDVLQKMWVDHEVVVASAHPTPDKIKKYAQTVRSRGIQVIIAAAGGSVGLPGVMASCTTLPVTGIPIPSSGLNGIDALYAIAQMPPSAPIDRVSVGSCGARNATLFATQIFGGKHEAIRQAYDNYRENMKFGS